MTEIPKLIVVLIPLFYSFTPSEDLHMFYLWNVRFKVAGNSTKISVNASLIIIFPAKFRKWGYSTCTSSLRSTFRVV